MSRKLTLYRSQAEIAEHLSNCLRLWSNKQEWRAHYPTLESLVEMVIECAAQKPEPEFPWWPKRVKFSADVSNIDYWQWWRFRLYRFRGLPAIDFARFGVEPAIYDRVIGMPYKKQEPCHRCRGKGDLYSTFSIHGRFCEECGGSGYEVEIEAARNPKNQERWKRQRLERYACDWRRWSKTRKWFSPWWNGGPA